jgi:heme exporter protein A
MTSANAFAPRAVRVSGLSLRRGEIDVVSRLSFEVRPGTVLLVRGPNGAGKSTLLLALAGLLRPEAGSIEVGAGPDERPATLLHFLGHLSAVRPHLTLGETLRFWGNLLGAPPPSPQVGGEAADPVSIALEGVGLGGLDGNDAGHLSQGQTRRLALARLLIASRPLWLLDEPTAALDAGGEALVGRLITEHCAAGGTVIAATHDDLDLERVKVETLRLGEP